MIGGSVFSCQETNYKNQHLFKQNETIEFFDKRFEVFSTKSTGFLDVWIK
jgi:hypothetical protein